MERSLSETRRQRSAIPRYSLLADVAALAIIVAIMVRILYREGSRLDRLLTSIW
ncbi:hypothetical protein ACIPLR_07295 [Herbaspirillum huttiense]|uniref:hypothetical protein n=1 Tax=Herbaspirillum huttiense TaxID=863372 RepID=UPI00382817F3